MGCEGQGNWEGCKGQKVGYERQGKEGEGCKGQGKGEGCEGQGKREGCEGQGKGVGCEGQGKEEGCEGDGRSRTLTPLEKLNHDVTHDERTIKEVTLGRRIGFYRLRGQIGSGNFSQVKLGIHVLTKEKVAIKILDKSKLDQKTERLLSREIASMERLHHPHIIRLYEVIETLTRLHLVLEYAAGGELFTSVSTEGPLPEDLARKLFAQIVSAVQHMVSTGCGGTELRVR
ncbi:serine/threonine-protein kinase NIM1-like [Callorhinchus milii]|uniref:serine/threonine-protein kinase NIM1-like n=1 Tax=Callorhinchus milii TaxID=7868 RepID=UPI001C3F7E3F|nr:serine/threonine-protein kinase NIM1-like [Callorhinchus milii]